MLISVGFLCCPLLSPVSSSIMDTSASDSPHRDMATTLVLPHSQPHLQNGSGVNRRYRPAPAKTFQCRGYGDCRMVFSRSEHLARHIRSVFLALSSPSVFPPSLTHSSFSRQEAHWRTSFHLPLWKAVLSSRQSAPTCPDCPCRQAGCQRAYDARALLLACHHGRSEQSHPASRQAWCSAPSSSYRLSVI